MVDDETAELLQQLREVDFDRARDSGADENTDFCITLQLQEEELNTFEQILNDHQLALQLGSDEQREQQPVDKPEAEVKRNDPNNEVTSNTDSSPSGAAVPE